MEKELYIKGGIVTLFRVFKDHLVGCDSQRVREKAHVESW